MNSWDFDADEIGARLGCYRRDMVRRSLALVLGLLSVGACRSSADPPAPRGASVSQPTPAPLAVETSPLTSERLLAAQGIADDLEGWTLGYPKVLARLGPPQRVQRKADGEYHQWAYADDAACTSFTLHKTVVVGGGVPQVARQSSPIRVAKPVKIDEAAADARAYVECLAILGRSPASDAGADERPDASR
jgi:hypothetical protein